MSYLFSPDNWEWLWTGNNARFIIEGFIINLEIALISIIFALIVGLALALLRLSSVKPVSVLAGAWVDLFRNLPLIFLILYFALALPKSWKDAWEDAMPGWAPEAFQSGLVLGAFLGLILYNSAVLAEIMRAGILSLPKGQGEAASALGMTRRQALRYVILPQGLRRMVPATVSQLITLNKDTTLVSIIAITEVMRRGRIVTSSGFFQDVTAPILQVFIFIGFLFVVVNYLLSRLSRRLEIRERKITGTKLKRVGGLEDQVAADPV
ncbi:amino acid ABC transporter membrane protein 2 (PAAT family) [Solirubrobacter pauli]|uniref:Amino acid ABC transporter membrane protein 2 (PAAT family) n=1 Tax=Solirubrobacter pauli TaxID=166793 RepID=A0A660LB23_9ACTN|nr:amino acid ABC transporter permease [Solirubrobacter pauli]RKQ90224.1 amino acid ABC transporter membrane protein 2 (PAAT family) [Solirubrobacter pauli]